MVSSSPRQNKVTPYLASSYSSNPNDASLNEADSNITKHHNYRSGGESAVGGSKYNVNTNNTNNNLSVRSEMDFENFDMDGNKKTTNQNEQNSHQKRNEKFLKRPFIVNSLLNFKNLIFLLVITCIVLFCLAYWFTVTFMTSHVAEELTRVILVTILQKVQNLLNDRFTIVKATTITMFRDWKTEHLKMVDGVHRLNITDEERDRNIMYLQSRVANYNMTGIAFHFGENAQLSQFGTLVSYTPTWEIDHFNFFYKETSAPLINKECKLKSGIIDGSVGNQRSNLQLQVNATKFNSMDMCIYQTSNSSLQITSQLETLTPTYNIIKNELVEKKGPFKPISGLWFEPYYNSIYSTGLFYAVPLYDDFGSYIGYVSTIFNLFKLGGCLKRFRCKTKGFVVLTEFKNNTVLAATVNGKTKDGLGRLKMWDMSDLNSGKVLKAAFDQGMDFYPKEYSDFQVEVDGVFYFIAHQRYKLLNDAMEWRLTIVVNDDNLQTLHYQQLYVSVGITIVFFVFGLLGSIAITYIVVRPLTLLQKDFANIAIMRLEKVESHSSIFSEYRDIYWRLEEMVSWLKDIRSFLPQSVLSQLESTETKEDVVTNIPSADVEISAQSHNDSGTISHHSHSQHSITHSHKRFATGLQYHKSSVIVSLQICNLMDMEHHDVTHICEKLIGSFYQLALTQRANLQISDLSKLRIIVESKEREESNKRKGLIIALKMNKTILHVNSVLENQGRIPITYHISVSSGSSYSGNVGTKLQRVYGILNRSVEKCDEMLIIASKLGIPIMVDHETISPFSSDFAYRPVDRVLFSSVVCDKKENHAYEMEEALIVYQLFDEIKVEHDEWMYELQGKEKYKHCEQFIERTRVLFVKNFASNFTNEQLQETLTESARLLEESQFENNCTNSNANQQSMRSLDKQPLNRDIVTDRLAQIMTTMAKESSTSFYTQVETRLREKY